MSGNWHGWRKSSLAGSFMLSVSFKTVQNMKKKSVVIIVIIAIVILCIAFFSYNYWKQGTPEYSFQQAQKAFSNHDTITFSQYFDSSEVFGNYWTRLIEQNTKAISEDTSSSQFQKAIDITNLN